MKKNFLILIALFALSNMAKAQDAETANRMFRRGYRADIPFGLTKMFIWV